MHTTTAILKDGTTIDGILMTFRPAQGFLTLLSPGDETVIKFDDAVSITTEGERIRLGVIGTMDELDRARKHMRDARQFGWDGVAKDMPLMDWEKPA